MLDSHRMPGMCSQFPGQARQTFVLGLAVECVELVVCFFPTLLEECEPLSGRTEKMQIIIQPNRLRIEGKPGDGELGYVHFLTVAFHRYVRHSLQSGFTGRKELYGSVCLDERGHKQRGLGCRTVVA